MAGDFQNRFSAVAKAIEEEASRLVRSTALGIEADVKASMTERKSGRTYRRRGREHTASARGEAPAVDSGGLVNSIETEMESALAAETGTAKEYAPLLEEVLERPAFAEAAQRAENTFQRNARRIR